MRDNPTHAEVEPLRWQDGSRNALTIVVICFTASCSLQHLPRSHQYQAKISKVVRGSPSQRLLRSNNKLFKEEEDESEDSLDAEERGFAVEDEEDLEERSPLSTAQVSKLEKYAGKWDTSYYAVAMGHSSVSKAKASALLALRDAYVSKDKSAIEAAKMAILRAN
ncbi:hypothetical protein PR003_g29973 [Phytophthora rubi]|uniref:Uncharacterized protein n=1 Tax=Phytophthora rubi TaxID=129364 RepID=A0A6A4BFF3_9STRA|nr:hypothetical protein PR002_g31886 [Phytophthora rubi]KAE9273204.1 hypothetical protein PR003_g29973 [Phytophthora rubi]